MKYNYFDSLFEEFREVGYTIIKYILQLKYWFLHLN